MALHDGGELDGAIPQDGDPLLVRPFILRDRDAPEPAPSAATWPSAADTPYREIRSHREAARIAAPAGTAGPPRRRRRGLALAGAGAAAALGLAAVGYGLVRPAPDGDEASIPSGALPPLPSAAAPAAPDGAPETSPPPATTARGTGTSPAGRRPPAATTVGTTAAAPASTPPAAVPSRTGATGAPAPQPPGPSAPALPTAARVGAIAGDGDLCLDLNGGVPVDDNHVQVFDCNGSPAQRWTLAPDGTLQVVGRCAQVVGDATVHIVGCDGRRTAQWRADGDDALVNLATGQCLTDPDNGTRSGAAVRLAPCERTDNQRWSLP
jgi:hypothetical protein